MSDVKRVRKYKANPDVRRIVLLVTAEKHAAYKAFCKTYGYSETGFATVATFEKMEAMGGQS